MQLHVSPTPSVKNVLLVLGHLVAISLSKALDCQRPRAGENRCRGGGSPDAAALRLTVAHINPLSQGNFLAAHQRWCLQPLSCPSSLCEDDDGGVCIFICYGNSGRAGWE